MNKIEELTKKEHEEALVNFTRNVITMGTEAGAFMIQDLLNKLKQEDK